MRTYYPAAQLESWLRANLQDWIRPDNPLGFFNDGDGLGPWCESDNWPAGANNGSPPTPAEVEAWQSPVIYVERMTGIFTEARRGAALYLDQLKGQIWDYLANVAKLPAEEVTAAGVLFNMSTETGIGFAYDDFVKNGGHPLAALALWQRIQVVKGNYAWLTPPVEAIFAAALGQS